MQAARKNNAGFNRFIAGGVLASMSASICCLGPFVLLATGISGAWMSNLMRLEPYQPMLIGLALIAFAIAGKRLFVGATNDEDGSCCDNEKIGWQQYTLYLSSFALALIFVTSEFWVLQIA